MKPVFKNISSLLILNLSLGLPLIILLSSCVSSPVEIPSRADITILPIDVPAHKEGRQSLEIEPMTLSLDEAITHALLNNPNLHALFSRFEQLSQQGQIASSLPDPKINYSQFVEGVQTRTGEQEFIIGVSQTVPWFGELELLGQIADTKALQAVEEYRIAMLDIRENVSTTFHRLAYQKAAQELANEDRSTLEQALEAVSSLYTTGQHGREALLKTQTELTLVENDLVAFPSTILALKSELARLLHVDQHIVIEEPLTYEDPVLTTVHNSLLFELAKQSRPEVKRILLGRDIADLELELAKKDNYPDITFGVNYIGIGNSPTNPSDEGDDAWNVGVSFNIPLPNARRKAAKKIAHTKAVEAEHKLSSQEDQIEKELTSILSELRSLEKQHSILQNTLIPLAQETFEASRISYESGQTTFLDLLDSQRTYINARAELLKVQRDYRIGMARFERAVGGKLQLTEIEGS